jgi:hypothetical protein
MERLAYLAAGLCIDSLGIDTERRRQYRERLHSWARLAFAFLEDLAPDRAYPETTLLRLLDLKERLPLEGRRPWEHGSADPGAELRAGHPPLSFRRTLLESMNAVGLISPIPGGAWGRTESAAPHPVSHAPRMIMSASYSCILYPEMPFQDALALARFCEVREVGRTVLFEINRDSVVRGFNLDLDVESVASILQGLSGKPLDQALLWSLKEWNDRYSGLALHRGIILTVAEDRAYLAKAEPVASMISRTLAPGVFLLSVPDESEAVRLLKKAGVDIVALPPLRSPAGGLTGESRHAHFPRLAAKAQGSGRHQPHRAEIEVPGLQASDSAVKAAGGSAGNGGSLDAAPVEAGGGSPDAAPRATDAAGRKSGAYDAAAAQAHLDRFRSLLEKKRLPKDQRDELSARINRRLILSDSQLVGAAVRYEKLEAKGLDYVGKVRVAEQAISTGSLVELFWRGPKGEPNRVLGSPKSLEKADGELMLIIEPVPQGDALTVAIGKISLLRRIKRSIFGE